MLNFNKFVSWSANYFGVEGGQIIVSLKKSSATKNLKKKFGNLDWEIEEIVENVEDYEGCCGVKVPKKMIHVNILNGKKLVKKITIYSHAYKQNDKLKTSITTSCRKSSIVPIWHLPQNHIGYSAYY